MRKLDKHLKSAVVLVLLITQIVGFTGCGDGEAKEALAPDVSMLSTQTENSDSNAPVNRSPPEVNGSDSDRRNYRTQLKGGGEDIVTLMLYLCGSDLESLGGAATQDLIEIFDADIADNLNIVVETGGALQWATEVINPKLNQRWQVTDDDFLLLEELEAKNMSEGATLEDFITYSAENFTADRYMLVLWDHGGGTVDGYAYDERFGENAMMSLPELDTALTGAGVTFDMIGFDCCLMGTAETAFMAEKHADYMVASQRVEPGNGWHYTSWVSALSEDTSIPTVELGKVIVDGFINESADGHYGKELTLAVTDLTYIPDLYETMYGFFTEAQDAMVEDGMFISTSQALGGSRAMQSEFDLVDMAYLIENMDGSEELRSKLKQCVVYNGTTIDNHSGLCLYFPYSDLNKVGDALSVCAQIGIDESYQDFIASFANLMLGGQMYNSGSTASENPMGGGLDLDSLMSNAWVDEGTWEYLQGFFEESSYDASELAIEEKGNEYVLSLTDEEWEQINAVEQRVFLDDGEGWIDLGADSVYEFDEDGDLLISFDNTWVALDGQLVCFYTEAEVIEDDYWYTYGSVPILYEDEYAEIVLMWDDENPEGYVAGWRYTELGSGSQKGLFELTDGMYFDFLCEYYTYDDYYDDQYLWGGITVDGPVTVSYEDVGEADVEVYYELIDLFNNSFWTESVIYSLDY